LAGHRPFGYPGWAAEVGVLQKIDGLNNSVSQAEADNWAIAMLSHCEGVCPGQFHATKLTIPIGLRIWGSAGKT